MPTPFQHLVYAERVLEHPVLSPQVRELLQRELGAFLLGTTAADVQAITGQPRVDTHFYRLSTGRNGAPVDKFLASLEPILASNSLTPAHAAFAAGYAVHLVWDEIWAWDIFVPYYRDGANWPDRQSFFVHHNALRIWLDQQALSELQGWADLATTLAIVDPQQWLPFAPDGALRRWRDWLVEQLMDPALVQTAQVFAERLHVPIARLDAIVAEMNARHYTVVPGLMSALAQYETAALTESVRVLGALSILQDQQVEPMLGLVR